MEPKREYGLDVLKAAAAALIVLDHFQLCIGADYRFPFYPGVGDFDFGYLVELFFLLSGLFAARYVQRIRDGLSFREFFLRRYLRLFPLMALSSACWSALFLLLGLHRLDGAWARQTPSLWSLAVTSLGVQAGWGFANSFINQPLWYLSVLIFCYLLFYVLVRVSKRLGVSPYYLFGGMIFVGAGIRSYDIELPFLNNTMSLGYCSFFAGVLLEALLRRRKPGKPVLFACALLVAGITALMCTDRFTLIGDIKHVLTFLYFPAIIVLFRSEAAARLFRSPVFGLLGRASFNVYVWHMSGILIVTAMNVRGLVHVAAHPMTVMYLFTLCCFAFGIFSHLCIEKPCARLTDRLLQKLLQK